MPPTWADCLSWSISSGRAAFKPVRSRPNDQTVPILVSTGNAVDRPAYPSGRISTAVGAATTRIAGSSHAPTHFGIDKLNTIRPRRNVESAGLTEVEEYRPGTVQMAMTTGSRPSRPTSSLCGRGGRALLHCRRVFGADCGSRTHARENPYSSPRMDARSGRSCVLVPGGLRGG